MTKNYPPKNPVTGRFMSKKEAEAKEIEDFFWRNGEYNEEPREDFPVWMIVLAILITILIMAAATFLLSL